MSFKTVLLVFIVVCGLFLFAAGVDASYGWFLWIPVGIYLMASEKQNSKS